jgi:hypothetical protein
LYRGVQPKLAFGPQISFFLIIWAAIYQKPKENQSKYRFFFKFWIQFGPHKTPLVLYIPYRLVSQFVSWNLEIAPNDTQLKYILIPEVWNIWLKN